MFSSLFKHEGHNLGRRGRKERGERGGGRGGEGGISMRLWILWAKLRINIKFQ